MKRNEIGSEFWERPAQKEKGFFKDVDFNSNRVRWFISGRTALDYIIRDIIKKHGRFSVAMPSYYCYSMLEPFLRNGINEIEFYDVVVGDNGIKVSSQITADVVFMMDYFGFLSKQICSVVNENSRKGKIIIYDLTQSVFCQSDYAEQCDYSFCSYRKWFFSNAAVAIAKQGFDVDYSEKEDIFFTRIRLEAAREKKEYIHCAVSEKGFLEKYHQADVSLRDDYVGYTPRGDEVESITCIDDGLLNGRRRENAAFIIRELREYTGTRFRLLNESVSEEDSPMFVPVLLDSGVRYNLRGYLIQHGIYCPIHWPITEYHDQLTERQKDMYNSEMSLVCDQRYDLRDMKREVDAIKSFFNENL